MIPAAFAQSTIDREGEAGAAWLAELPGIVDELLERWSCAPDGDVTHGGVGVIVPVRRAAQSAVLKVSFPHPGNVHEPDAFTVCVVGQQVPSGKASGIARERCRALLARRQRA